MYVSMPFCPSTSSFPVARGPTRETNLGAGGSEKMKEASSSSNTADPRQPSTAKPYVPPVINPQDLPADYAGFIAMMFAVAGVMFRYKLCSWLALIFCAQSLANMRNMESDLKQISMAMMFAIMGFVTNYYGPARPAATKR